MKLLHKILVVDDDKVTLQIILKHFNKIEDKDFELISATSGETALKILNEKEIHLVLLDWVMPGLTGIDVLERMQSNPDTRDIPVLMITGRTENTDLEFALEKGAHDYIKKPINRVELIARTKSALRVFDYLKKIKEQKKELEHTHKDLIDTYQEIQDSEKQLSEMNQVKNKFFSVISHDLKSPLNSLQMLLKMLLDEMDFLSKDEIRELIEKIDSRLDDTQLLMTNLLKWAKNQMDGLVMVFEDVDLRNVMSRNVTFFKEHIKRENLKVDVKYQHDEEFSVKSSEEMLDFIIRNLLHNVIKNSASESQIEIVSLINDDNIEIVINSNNIDLKVIEQKEIFNLVTYASDKGSTNERGVGLGLILCKEFVENNNGYLKVEGKKPSSATFSFSLPTVEKG